MLQLSHNLPKFQITRLQQIQNSLARNVVKAPKSSHITPVLPRSILSVESNQHEESKAKNVESKLNKKLSYHRGTARCVVSVEILPIATQQCRNYLYD